MSLTATGYQGHDRIVDFRLFHSRMIRTVAGGGGRTCLKRGGPPIPQILPKAPLCCERHVAGVRAFSILTRYRKTAGPHGVLGRKPGPRCSARLVLIASLQNPYPLDQIRIEVEVIIDLSSLAYRCWNSQFVIYQHQLFSLDLHRHHVILLAFPHPLRPCHRKRPAALLPK